jgi:hypothetical protein
MVMVISNIVWILLAARSPLEMKLIVIFSAFNASPPTQAD